MTKLMVSIVLSVLCFGCKAVPKETQSAVAENSVNKPNILFIAVDDLNDWTGFLNGHPQAITPNMDKLAASGMVFERAYCAASVCNPSRAAIMSGYRPSTSGVYQNKQKPFENELIKNSVMLPQYFSSYGYTTFSRGKIYHSPNTGKHTWDNWSKVTGTYGQKNTDDGIMKNGIPEGLMPDNMDWQGTDEAVENTPDFLNAKWAAALLQQKHDAPFFIGLGIFRPHLEWNVPKAFFDKFPLESLVMPKVLETDLEDVGENAKPTKEYLTIKKYGKEREAVQAYLASIAYADYCIGQALDALENSQYADNTIVVLWGDHGWHLGEKLRYKKFTLWDRASRVPLIIKAPGITTPGSRTKATVNLLDLYPTLTALAGLPANEKNDGMDFSPLLKQPNLTWNYPSLTQMGEGRNSLRNEQFRYIRYADGEEELYDHKVDSLEWKNLIGDTDYEDIRKNMSAKLNKILTTTTKSKH